MKKTGVKLIGIGNAFRRDDGLGPILVRRLRSRIGPNIAACEQSGEGAALMEAWKDADAVVVLDAVASGEKPGTVHRFNVNKESLPTKFFHYSTHAFSLAEAVETARALGALPKRMYIYGIEGKDFGAGEGLSPEVEASARQIEDEVVELCTNSL